MNEAGPIGIGVVGCGRVLNSYGARLRLLAQDGLVRLVAASDIDAARVDQARTQLGAVRFSTRIEDVTEADDVDLVLVLSSPPNHGQIALAALQAGKHVLVEKPMAPTLDEAARLVSAARENDRYLVCAPHMVLSPTFQIMWKRLRAGEIGKVCLARARYGEGSLWWGPWRYEGPGSGPLFECGVYPITTLTGLLGPARRVTAMAGIAVPERIVGGKPLQMKTYDNMQLIIDFGEATLATVATGYTMLDHLSPAIELWGSEGVLQMLGDDWAPEGYELWQATDPVWRRFADADPLWHWTEGIKHLVDCIRTDQPLLITPEHAYHVQEIMIRAEESALQGRAIDVSSTFADVPLDPAAIDVTRQKRHGRPLSGVRVVD